MLARLSLSLLLIALPASGAAQTWQVGYDASLDSLPSAQGWTHVASDPLPDDGLDEGNYLVFLGSLRQADTGGASTDPGNVQLYQHSLPSPDVDSDVLIVDARLHILSSSMSGPGLVDPRAGFGIQLWDRDSIPITLYIGTPGLFVRVSNVTSSLVAFDTTAAFVDYRLRIDRHGAILYLNGLEALVLERTAAWTGGGMSESFVRFGDLSTGHRSSSELEHIRVSRFSPPSAEVRNYSLVSSLSPSDSSAKKSLGVACPAGTKILGGGVSTLGADGSLGLTDSLPDPGTPDTRWYGAAREIADTGASWQLRVDAICGEISGHRVVLADQFPLTSAPGRSTSLFCGAGTGQTLFSGGAGIHGAELRQALVTNDIVGGLVGAPNSWEVVARDFGAGATSSAGWGLRTAGICTDAPRLEKVAGVSASGPGSVKEATASCPSGKVPIAGGARIVGHGGGDSALRYSRPEQGAPGEPYVGWIAAAQSTSSDWYLQVAVICAPRADPRVSTNGLIGRWAGEFDATDSWGIRHGSLENGVGFDPAVFGQGFRLDPPPPEAQAKPWVQVPNRSVVFATSFAPEPTATQAAALDLYPGESSTADAWIVTDTVDPNDFSTVLQLRDLAGPEPIANCSAWQILLTAEGFPFANARSAQPFCSAASVTAGPSIADGRPHHLALRRDVERRRLSLWVDGVRVSENSLTLDLNEGPLFPSTPLGDPLSIGASRMDGSTGLFRPFNGLIDDVKYYDRALSDEEIREIAGCGVPLALPRVINLDAARFGQPSIGPEGLCVFLEEGRYRLTLVNPSVTSTARFTAWSPSPAHPWSTVYTVRGEVDPGLVSGFPTGSATPQEAFDATVTREATLPLSADQRVYFSAIDEFALDNRGGVSIRIEAAPPDSDGDAIEDPDDNCPAFPNAAQSDVDQNGIGDACECGDQNGDGTVNVLDLLAINLAIFTPALATPLCDTNEDGLCNVIDIIGANLKIFGQSAYCSRYPSP